ncbi:hypothetical protein ACF060_02065 [Streptomyces werraensis]|uniref:hypothetical protein n=1 Tax=Streptomyces werraensis TaxID=68284 RepID=UPI0036FD2DE4
MSVAALLRPAAFLPGSVLERTRTVTLRAASLRTRTLRLSRPLPGTLCLLLLLPGPALRPARTALGVAGAAGPLLLARAVLRRPGTDGARQAWRTSNWVRSATSRTSATTSPRSRTSLS